jgi:hypothetical protein
MVLVFLSFFVRLELSYIVIFSTCLSTLFYYSYVVVVASIVIVI